ncbi:hypothetical protein QFC21_006956 [Naganishia friedmannii]|uniref:Uncharacterized protein n=1 Tax=Naganishia friedmannii TaxID=89922 RepID=A0ACC2UZB7_9TREE|nr:hypothetical protein QFC21_006956 [Naganishia friedmannii]
MQLGADRTYLSIYESNSVDATPQLLHAFSRTLDSLNIPHRIITDKTTTRHWPHGASEERIAYLAAARNKALEPLASPDASLRLDDYEAWGQGRVLFLNDVIFGWRDAIELLATRLEGEPDGAQQNKVEGEGDYDLACAMDFGWSGLYAIPFWPYVKDPVSVEKMKKEQVMEVGACWNGIVAFRSDLVAYRSPQETPLLTTQLNSGVEVSNVTKRSIQKRGWQMVDNVLFSYDLHRLYPTAERKPRILLNPRVRVAYEKRWWVWHNVVLEIPVIKFWLNNWSRGYPLAFVDWIWESARRRDYCTWAGLSTSRPARCPALPGAIDRSWDQG